MVAAAPVAARAAAGRAVPRRARPALDDALFAPLDGLRAAGAAVAVVDGAADDVLAAADVVVTASGTATVQTALHGKPMVIVYRCRR